MNSTMTIGKKLFLATCTFVVLNMTLGYWSISSIRSAKQRFDFAVAKTAKKLELGGEIDTLKSDMYSIQESLLLAAFLKDTARSTALRQEFVVRTQKMSAVLDEIRPLISVPEGRRLLLVAEERYQTWLPQFQEAMRMVDAGDPVAASRHSFAKSTPAYAQMGDALSQFIQVYRRVLEQGRAEADQEFSNTLWISAILIALSLVCSGAVLVVVRGIGNRLKDAVFELREGANQVASAAAQVASSSQSLAQDSSRQAALLEETSASTQEINSLARKNTEDCHGAADLVAQTQDRFAHTHTALSMAVVAMSEINGSSEKISKIIKVIDEIAFQTNILALNAAVEAARAGEAGMGFAVVADEVRNLAQRCAQAARDTASLIEESIKKSKDGTQKVDEVAQAIRDITDDAAKVRLLVEAVNGGSQEQSRGIKQIAKSVSQLDQVTQTTAAAAEESASAAQELNAQAEAVRSIVDGLSAMVDRSGLQRSMQVEFAGRKSRSGPA